MTSYTLPRPPASGHLSSLSRLRRQDDNLFLHHCGLPVQQGTTLVIPAPHHTELLSHGVPDSLSTPTTVIQSQKEHNIIF